MGRSKADLREEEIHVEEVTINDFNILEHYYDKETGDFGCPLAVLLGRRRSGKSVKLISLLSECRDVFGSAWLFSPTAFSSGVFQKIFSPVACFRIPTEDILRGIQTLQEWLTETKPSFLTTKDLICLIVLDDCGSLAFMKSKYLEELACNCRNIKITLWFTLQNFNQVQPAVRDNCDIFLSNLTSNVKIQKKMFDEFFSCFGTLECFVEALKHCAQKFGSIVWRNAGEFDDVEHSVFRYRCSNTDANSFKLNVPMQNLINELFGKTPEEQKREAAENLVKMSDKVTKSFGVEEEVDEEMEMDPDEEDLVGLKNQDEELVTEPRSDSDNDGFQAPKKPRRVASNKKRAPAKPMKSEAVKQKNGKKMRFVTAPIAAK